MKNVWKRNDISVKIVHRENGGKKKTKNKEEAKTELISKIEVR